MVVSFKHIQREPDVQVSLLPLLNAGRDLRAGFHFNVFNNHFGA